MLRKHVSVHIAENHLNPPYIPGQVGVRDSRFLADGGIGNLHLLICIQKVRFDIVQSKHSRRFVLIRHSVHTEEVDFRQVGPVVLHLLMQHLAHVQLQAFHHKAPVAQLSHLVFLVKHVQTKIQGSLVHHRRGIISQGHIVVWHRLLFLPVQLGRNLVVEPAHIGVNGGVCHDKLECSLLLVLVNILLILPDLSSHTVLPSCNFVFHGSGAGAHVLGCAVDAHPEGALGPLHHGIQLILFRLSFSRSAVTVRIRLAAGFAGFQRVFLAAGFAAFQRVFLTAGFTGSFYVSRLAGLCASLFAGVHIPLFRRCLVGVHRPRFILERFFQIRYTVEGIVIQFNLPYLPGLFIFNFKRNIDRGIFEAGLRVNTRSLVPHHHGL